MARSGHRQAVRRMLQWPVQGQDLRFQRPAPEGSTMEEHEREDLPQDLQALPPRSRPVALTRHPKGGGFLITKRRVSYSSFLF